MHAGYVTNLNSNDRLLFWSKFEVSNTLRFQNIGIFRYLKTDVRIDNRQVIDLKFYKFSFFIKMYD